MKQRSKKLLVFVLPGLAFIVAAVLFARRGRHINIPNGDIVFTRHIEGPRWGFVDLDTDSVEYLDVEPGWDYPTITADQRSIIFRSAPTTVIGELNATVGVSLSTNLGVMGQFAGGGVRICDEITEIMTGRVRWAEAYSYQLLATTMSNEVVLIDPSTCEISQTIHSFSQEDSLVSQYDFDGEIFVSHAALSNDEILAVTICCIPDSLSSVLIVNLNQLNRSVYFLEEATRSVWSPDDEFLSYVGRDGIYLIQSDGSERRKVIDYEAATYSTDEARWVWNDWLPTPEWSPDGTKLVYHRLVEEHPSTWSRYDVYIYDLETGQEKLLIENGMNPFWRR